MDVVVTCGWQLKRCNPSLTQVVPDHFIDEYCTHYKVLRKYLVTLVFMFLLWYLLTNWCMSDFVMLVLVSLVPCKINDGRNVSSEKHFTQSITLSFCLFMCAFSQTVKNFVTDFCGIFEWKYIAWLSCLWSTISRNVICHLDFLNKMHKIITVIFVQYGSQFVSTVTRDGSWT